MSLKERFIFNFIESDRWRYLWDGLGATLKVTFFALIVGVIIGIVVAIIRSTHDKNIKDMKGASKAILKVLDLIARVYLTVIRGTPVVVQLMIMYYVVMVSSTNKILVATIAFGMNSGAYVAEIFRSGIMSIDNGQFEAGRSLGFNFVQTMRYIIIPQAFKNVLPALANEFIVLLKETSVSGYVAMHDLTKGGVIIRSRTYDAFMPLNGVALIYLVMVMFFTYLVGIIERRLRNSER